MKKFVLLFTCSSLLYGATQALAQQEMVDTAAFRMIRNAEMNNSHIPEIAYNLTDASGPRLTNSPGFFRAANWAVETMKKWGLANAALEPWGEYGRGWEVQDFSLSVESAYHNYIIGYPMPWAASTNGAVRAPLYKMLNSDLTDPSFMAKHKDDFKNRIIFITDTTSRHHMDDLKPFAHRFSDSELVKLPGEYMFTRKEVEDEFIKSESLIDAGLAKLKTYGAVGVLYASGYMRDGTMYVDGIGGYKTHAPEFAPEAYVSSEDGFKINRLLAHGQPVEAVLNIKAKFYSEDTKGYNVVAEIPGTDPTLKAQLVMLGGHLDSWAAATGATDNGAGCIVMMEAVRLLDSLHLKPKRTIRIALWSGEEEGLLGSKNYVKNHFGDGETGLLKLDQANLSAYFNLDYGTGKIRGVYTQGNAAVKPIFEEWLKPFNDLGAKTVTLSSTGGTDHLSFDWAGIPGFQFIQDPLDYDTKTHHTNMDTYDYLRIDDLKQAAIIVASFVYQASMRPELLPRKKMVNEKFVFDGF